MIIQKEKKSSAPNPSDIRSLKLLLNEPLLKFPNSCIPIHIFTLFLFDHLHRLPCDMLLHYHETLIFKQDM